ncbi:hypothetical protein EVAR_103206_1 [Eumeta japonica]|uniref:Uncharacterized protein n=1 Tax=Eumeta variegata TaxID=151549 RepID=A0A4C1ZXD7_EUMVA|nr:hypothetical protein EVAR_103206_1 [Eumeta japonica]
MTPTSVRGHFGMEMPSARDCPMGVFTRHLGIGSHVKLQCGLQLPKSDTGRRWERTGLVTFKVVMGGQSYSYSIAISLTSISFSTSTVRSSGGSNRTLRGLLQNDSKEARMIRLKLLMDSDGYSLYQRNALMRPSCI